MTSCLSKFEPPNNSQILIYVDDVLLAAKTEKACWEDTLALLKFLADHGHRVNKDKLQLCRKEVTYLGHALTNGSRALLAERKTAILEAPKPKTKKQMMSFLGLVNFCRSWVLDYAVLTAPLQELIYDVPKAMKDELQWTPEAESSFEQIKQVLAGSGVLRLPDYDKPFVQIVDCKGDYMTSVLMQEYGGKR